MTYHITSEFKNGTISAEKYVLIWVKIIERNEKTGSHERKFMV